MTVSFVAVLVTYSHIAVVSRKMCTQEQCFLSFVILRYKHYHQKTVSWVVI